MGFLIVVALLNLGTPAPRPADPTADMMRQAIMKLVEADRLEARGMIREARRIRLEGNKLEARAVAARYRARLARQR